MLLNNLYTVRLMESAPDGSAFRSEIRLDARHPIFEGHFPGNPILPGVCTVQIVRELLELSMGRTLRMVKADNIKYLGFVNPGETPELGFQIQVKEEEKGILSCTAVVNAKGVAICTFKGEFRT